MLDHYHSAFLKAGFAATSIDCISLSLDVRDPERSPAAVWTLELSNKSGRLLALAIRLSFRAADPLLLHFALPIVREERREIVRAVAVALPILI